MRLTGVCAPRDRSQASVRTALCPPSPLRPRHFSDDPLWLSIGILYILNYIDRQNLSAAKVQGIMEDLNLTTEQFATAISILFVGYLPFQIPSNLLITKISRPGLCASSASMLPCAGFSPRANSVFPSPPFPQADNIVSLTHRHLRLRLHLGRHLGRDCRRQELFPARHHPRLPWNRRGEPSLLPFSPSPPPRRP